jgi:hydroxymethylpyrimidine pyrophosphatase-like HAD family hydrolase
MMPRALACDYDGTLATQDRLAPATVGALERARAAGLRLVLLTGRAFFELTRVCERLDLFDAVVAENGAVLYFPGAGTLRDLAPAPSPRLLAELARQGIAYHLGRVVVGTLRSDEARVREALAAAGIELELVYNRGALMLLPPGVSKGTGLRQVIRQLGLSFHDVLGFGDAENDQPLFDACGVTACPADAVPALRARADWILPGGDGAAVAQAITAEILAGRVSVAGVPRHRVALGWARGTTEPIAISARDINVLIQGDPLSGKSWLAGALVERLLGRRYAVCVIDPEGDYLVLGALPGVTNAEIAGEPGLAGALDEFEHDPAAALVADLSGLSHRQKLRAVERGLGRIRDLRARLGRPHWVVLDEAHYWLHPDGVAEDAFDLAEKGFCFPTYRASRLRPSVARAIDVFLLTRTTAPDELAFLRTALSELGPGAARAVESLPALPPGEFVLVQGRDAGPADPVTFAPVPRETTHVRHLRKYAEGGIPAERRFHFRQPDGRVVATADSLASFRDVVATADEQVLAFHAERGDFSRWVLGVFSDPALSQQLRKLESRWRRGEIEALRPALDRLIAARYGAR